MLEIDIKLLPLQGVTNERALPQGVASLALGYVLHWAFSPPLLNPKFESEFSEHPFNESNEFGTDILHSSYSKKLHLRK